MGADHAKILVRITGDGMRFSIFPISDFRISYLNMKIDLGFPSKSLISP